MSRKILWIVPKWPFPSEDGSRIATARLIKELVKLGESIYLLAIAGREEQIDFDQIKKELGVQGVYVVRRAPAARTLENKVRRACFSMITHPRLPVTVAAHAKRDVSAAVESVLHGKPSGSVLVSKCGNPATQGWDLLVYDSLHGAGHSAPGGRFCVPLPGVPVVYRAHNCEYEIWRRKAKQMLPVFSPILRLQAAIMKRFEQSLVAASSALACVSLQDLLMLTAQNQVRSADVVPVGYDFPPPPGLVPDPPYQIMFLGSLDWPPNREGLVWFLENVWPEVRSKRGDLILAVAGSGSSDYLKKYKSLPAVRFLGRIDSVDYLYKQSILAIVPVFWGSGTRVKAIEAARFARPCLSTMVGVEGIGLTPQRSFLHGETAESWIDLLLKLDVARCAEVGLAAWEDVKGRFCAVAAAKRFTVLLDAAQEDDRDI